MKKIFIPVLFSLLISGLNAQYNDCNKALLLCSNENFIIDKIDAKKNADGSEIKDAPCCPDYFPERNSVWMYWKAGNNGELSFDITPLKATDDLDFILYRVDASTICSEKEIVRCMSSGENKGDVNKSTSIPCAGKTGLKNLEIDLFEESGCEISDNNYLSPVECKKGEVYLLFINNYDSESGFEIEFGRDVYFQSPEPQLRLVSHDVKNRFVKIASIDNNFWTNGYWQVPGLFNIIDETNNSITLQYPTDADVLSVTYVIKAAVACNKEATLRIDIPEIEEVEPTEGNISLSVGFPYPNPSQEATFIDLTKPESMNFDLNLYSVSGKKVQSYVEQSGNQVRLDVRDLSPGVYLIEVLLDGEKHTRKLEVIR